MSRRRDHDEGQTPLPWMYSEATAVDAADARRALQEVYALLLAASRRAAAETPPPKGREPNGGQGLIAPEEESGAGPSCHTEPAPPTETPALSCMQDRSERHPHFTAGSADAAGGDLCASDPAGHEALVRVSTTMMRALMHIEANERRASASGPTVDTPSS
jgi:hypothetical protein